MTSPLRLALAVFAAVAAFSCRPPPVQPTRQVASLAGCLAERGYVLYKVGWCEHCARQLEMFGTDADFLEAVECNEQLFGEVNQACVELDVSVFPTWIGPDGERREGVLTLDQLRDWSGC